MFKLLDEDMTLQSKQEIMDLVGGFIILQQHISVLLEDDGDFGSLKNRTALTEFLDLKLEKDSDNLLKMWIVNTTNKLASKYVSGIDKGGNQFNGTFIKHGETEGLLLNFISPFAVDSELFDKLARLFNKYLDLAFKVNESYAVNDLEPMESIFGFAMESLELLIDVR